MSQLLWRETVKAALVGTAQGAGIMGDAGRQSGDRVGTMLDQGVFASAEDKLLTQAGMLAYHTLIGTKPARHPEPLTARPQLAQKQSPVISELMGMMLDGRYKDILPELLELMAARGVTCPVEHVPNLLAYAATSVLNRHLVIGVLSEHDRMVAGLNPRWSFAAGDILTWQGAVREMTIAKPAQRQAFLRQLRHLDADFGRSLLKSRWKAEQPHVRLWYLRILQINLSMADEPLLEIALDDRALSVRKEAVLLLAGLPQSRLCQRMQNNVRHVLTWDAREKHLVVRFPTHVGRLLQRDGVPIAAAGKEMTARLRGEQLRAMVGAVRLGHWEEKFGVSVGELLEDIEASRWPRTLMRAFTEAALRQKNGVWARAILAREIKAQTAKLFNLLTVEEREILFAELAEQYGGVIESQNPLVLCAYHLQGAWSAGLTRTMLGVLQRHLDSAEPDFKNPQLSNTIRKMARGCPPEMADEVAATFERYLHFPAWRTKLLDAITLAHLRKRMAEALR